MRKNEYKEFKNLQCSNNNFGVSQDNVLRNHNEKRKAQDSNNKELKNSQRFSK